LDPIRSHFHPLLIFTHHYSKVYFNNTFPHTARSPKWYLPLRLNDRCMLHATCISSPLILS
jgi:hypothetical protein